MFYMSMMFVFWENSVADEPSERATRHVEPAKGLSKHSEFVLSSFDKMNHNIRPGWCNIYTDN